MDFAICLLWESSYSPAGIPLKVVNGFHWNFHSKCTFFIVLFDPNDFWGFTYQTMDCGVSVIDFVAVGMQKHLKGWPWWQVGMCDSQVTLPIFCY
jgi:hypothetical protein